MGDFTKDDLVRVKNRVAKFIDRAWIPINGRDSFMVVDGFVVSLANGVIIAYIQLPAGTLLKYPMRSLLEIKGAQFNQEGFTFFQVRFERSGEFEKVVKTIQKLWWLQKVAKREFQLAKG
jgi:hypothetical protein